MGKRALFIVPDSGSSHYHLGEVATNGCYGRVPIFWFFPTSGMYQTDGNNFLSLSGPLTFTGTLILPQVESYKLPGRGGAVVPGVYLSPAFLRDEPWYLANARGVARYTDDEGFLSGSPGLPIQVREAEYKITLIHTEEVAEPARLPVLERLKRQASDGPHVRVYGVAQGKGFIVEVEIVKEAKDLMPDASEAKSGYPATHELTPVVEELSPPPPRRRRKSVPG